MSRQLQGTPLLHTSSFLSHFHIPIHSSISLPHSSHLYFPNTNIAFQHCKCLGVSFKGNAYLSCTRFKVSCWQMIDSIQKCSVLIKDNVFDGEESDAFPHIQTLRSFPIENLFGKVVMVRFDSTLLLREASGFKTTSVNRDLLTIKYLYNAGATVLITSSWGQLNDTMLLSTQSVADYLSSLLQLKVVPAKGIFGYTQTKMEELEKADIFLLENLSKFKEEFANCSMFAKALSSKVDIFVNDAFSQSHKILASTVGVARFCNASMAGFRFEEDLSKLVEVTGSTRKPYFVIIGGGNLLEKSTAMLVLASKCDGMVFVGMMAFQIMHALGLPVSSSLVEHDAVGKALEIIQLAHNQNIPIIYPKDFWCESSCLPKQLDVFPAHKILNGWTPIDLGPVSLDEISSLLSKCKKVLWIGPVKFSASRQGTHAASKLALMLGKVNHCDVTIVGHAACKEVIKTAKSLSVYNMYANASVVWEFLKGRVLPGVAALDRAYPFELDWKTIFADAAQPLVVDIGSGNGLFLLGMARKWKHLNFLGLEINNKLVKRCLDSIQKFDLKNGYFILTNATSTFRSIISSYPGELVLVSIQCPNPDFNKPEHRWRMLRRTLIEAITDLLTTDGKVFLQSDIEAIAIRMKEQFLMYGEGKLAILNGGDDLQLNHEGWIKENPFGIRSDWEQHVVDRGAPMYRIMISKIGR